MVRKTLGILTTLSYHELTTLLTASSSRSYEVAGCKPELYKVVEWDVKQVYILIHPDIEVKLAQVTLLSANQKPVYCSVLTVANQRCLW